LLVCNSSPLARPFVASNAIPAEAVIVLIFA
jgi:hypothetical protein